MSQVKSKGPEPFKLANPVNELPLIYSASATSKLVVEL